MKFEVALDEKSIEILKRVDKIHSNSLINFALRLLESHPHYKILLGEAENEVIPINEVSKEPEKPKEVKKEEPKNDIIDLGDFLG